MKWCFSLLLACSASAQFMSPGDPTLQPSQVSSGGGGATYLVKQGFETATTGYDNGETWFQGANILPAFTGEVLDGSQSCLIYQSSSTFTLFSGQSDVWLFAMVRTTNGAAIPAVNPMISFRDSSSNEMAKVAALSSGVWRSYNNTVNASGGSWSTNQTFYIWFHYEKGTGANGKSTLYVSTTSTRPAATASVTTGNGTNDVAQIVLWSASAIGMVFDKIRVSATAIGDNPT